MIRYYVVTFNICTSGTSHDVPNYFYNGIERYFKKFYSKTKHITCVEKRVICEMYDIDQTRISVERIAIGVAVSDSDFSMTAFADMINWVNNFESFSLGLYTEYEWCNGATPDEDLEGFDIHDLIDREFEDL